MAARDSRWEARQMALGGTRGSLPFRVFDADDFSSFLPRLSSRGPRELRIETIPVETLDSAVGERIAAARKPLLKIDVQGYEQEVLAGAAQSLSLLQGLLLEVCLVPHYGGEWLFEDVLSFCRKAGFTPYSLRRCFHEGDRDINYDALFVRL